MRVLLVNLNPCLHFFIESLKQSCHEFVILDRYNNLNLSSRFKRIEIKNRYELKLSYSDYNWEYLYPLIKNTIKKENIDFIFPYWPEINLEILAELGEDKFPVRNFEILSSKSKYSNMFEQFGIRVPETYFVGHPNLDLVEKIKTPCVCKPVKGTGGLGVFRANNKEELEHFLSPEKNFDKLEERTKFYIDRTNGILHNYLYQSLGGEYLIQECIDGYILSVSGIKFCNSWRLDLVYDIECNKQCSEIGFSYPSRFKGFDKIENVYSKVFNNIDFGIGPFMSDFIVKDNELFLIDFGFRMSSSGFEILSYFDSTYVDKVIQSSIDGKPFNFEINSQPFFSGFFDLPAGIIKSVKYPNQEKDQIYVDKTLNPGKRLFNSFSDLFVYDRGSGYFTGKNVIEAKRNFNRYQNQIEIEYE